jgi:hypothetical protein
LKGKSSAAKLLKTLGAAIGIEPMTKLLQKLSFSIHRDTSNIKPLFTNNFHENYITPSKEMYTNNSIKRLGYVFL